MVQQGELVDHVDRGSYFLGEDAVLCVLVGFWSLFLIFEEDGF